VPEEVDAVRLTTLSLVYHNYHFSDRLLATALLTVLLRRGDDRGDLTAL